MSGNMWALLRLLRDAPQWCYEIRRQTRDALESRGLSEYRGGCIHITDLGRRVCDAYTEGQESVR